MNHIFDPLVKQDYVPGPEESDIQNTILYGFHYMETHIPQKTSISRLAFDQIHYISPVLWAAQFVALILLIFAAFTARDMSYDMAMNTLFLLASLTAIFAIPELFKDVSCGVLEIEMTCKNNCASIFSIRLIIVGFLNITMITLFSSILSAEWGLRFWSIILYGLIPVNLIYIFNFLLFRMLKICGRFSVLSCSVITAFLVYTILSGITAIVQLSEAVWVGIFALTSSILIGQCINEISRFSKRQEVVLWN